MELVLSIGVPTYNSFTRVDHLLSSLYTITNYDRERYKVVILDDGTPNQDVVKKLEEVCQRFEVDFIRHTENRGIPAAWNSLTKHFETKYTIILNDDITITNPHWLTCMEYFLEHNEQVGTVGFPLIHMDPNLGTPWEPINPANWGTRPGRVGAAVGCSFGFKKAHWAQIPQLDGSVGFPEYYGSFHEETDFGMECAKRGWRSYQLYFPPVEHWRSRTFSLNHELAWWKFDERYISKEEYVRWASACTHTKNFWGSNTNYMTDDQRVDRMSWSRILFAKKWNVDIESIDNPQLVVHQRVVDVLEPIAVKWLDENLQPQEAVIP